MQHAIALLASTWGVEMHAVDFLFATRPLSSLSRVTSEHEWEQMLREVDGLVDANLLYAAIDWLQRDHVQL